MAKTYKFSKGDLVSGKKWNGEHFIGVYQYEYDCGDHCIFDGNKQYCIHKKDCHTANEEEQELIKENIVKPMREKAKTAKKAKQEENQTNDDELETLLTEEVKIIS